MPLTKKGTKIMAALKKQYGSRAKNVFYAMANSCKIRGVEKGKRRKC